METVSNLQTSVHWETDLSDVVVKWYLFSNITDVDKIEIPSFFSASSKPTESNNQPIATVHNQEDGTLFSVCIVALQGDMKASTDPSIDFKAGKISLVREWVTALEAEHGMQVAEKNLIFRIRFADDPNPDAADDQQTELTEESKKLS